MPEITSQFPPGGSIYSTPAEPARAPRGGQFTSTSPGGVLENNLSFAWVQYTGNSPGWTGDLSIMAGGSRSALVIDTLYEDGPLKLATCIREILGWSRKAGTGLTRKVPWRNPWLPLHAATGIPAVSGVKIVGASAGPLGFFPTYRLWRITVGFEQMPYRVMTDAKLAAEADPGEWHRWTSRTREPRDKYLNRDVADWVYAEGTGVPPTAEKGSYSIIELTTLHLYKWWFVPDDGLFNAAGRSPQIDAGVGCVNATAWEGFEAGTLLLAAPKFETVALPALFDGAGLVQAEDLPLAHHVTFPMIHFDPPRGPGVTLRGHNLVPRSDGLYYPIKAPGGGAPRYLYPSYEYRTLWTMNA
jgi:hypothetical protein